MIHKYRKLPVAIDAVQIKQGMDYPDWLDEAVKADIIWINGMISGDLVARIRTLEGVMIASMGDWIIKGVQGEFYSCKPDIFSKTYEKL